MRSRLIGLARKMLASGIIPGLKYGAMRIFWKLSFQARHHDENAPKVTLILPVYNVEEYLADCLLSNRCQR